MKTQLLQTGNSCSGGNPSGRSGGRGMHGASARAGRSLGLELAHATIALPVIPPDPESTQEPSCGDGEHEERWSPLPILRATEERIEDWQEYDHPERDRVSDRRNRE